MFLQARNRSTAIRRTSSGYRPTRLFGTCNSFPDPKPKNETVLKLRLASWIWFSGRKRRRRNARETTQRGADRLRLAASGRGQEGRRSLSGDGGIAASVLSVETEIRRSGIGG